MPVHKTRKRYVLFRWQKDDSPSRWEFEKFLSAFNDEKETGGSKQFTRLMILDNQSQMAIIRTKHILVSRLKTQLAIEGGTLNLPKLEVIAVSGTMKKLKLRLFSASPNSRNKRLTDN